MDAGSLLAVPLRLYQVVGQQTEQATLQHPDFKHDEFAAPLWLNNGHNPVWVDSQVATWDAGVLKRISGGIATSVRGKGSILQHDSHFEVRMCNNLCNNGSSYDALKALNIMVQRGRHVPSNVFHRVLKRCIAEKDFHVGRSIHALIVDSGYDGDDFLATHLIGMYASHGRFLEAMRVFTKISTPSAYSWGAIIFAYARKGDSTEVIQLYRQMRLSTTKPDNLIFSAVLKACAISRDLIAGKEIHAHILTGPEKPDGFVQSGLLVMYAKCGRLEDARKAFDSLQERDVAAWNAMLGGYAQKGLGQEALTLYTMMQQEGLCRPTSVTFVCLLQACASLGVRALNEGKKLQAQIEERGMQFDVVLGGSLVNMYAKCGSIVEARGIFDRLPGKNVVTWNAMIAGYAQLGMGQEALSMHSRMIEDGLSVPNSRTYVCLLQACASMGAGALDEGKKLHAQIESQGLHNDVALGGSLVNMYAKCGSLQEARRLFDGLLEKNPVTWNAMIAGYAQNGMGQEALSLYDSLQQGLIRPDCATFTSLLQSCASLGVAGLLKGMQLHTQIQAQGLQNDVVLGGSMVNMYAKCGSLDNARTVFDSLKGRNIVTWNAMLGAYAQKGMGREALRLYDIMLEEGILSPDLITFVSLLQACASVGVGGLRRGKQLHAQIKERCMQDDAVLGCNLVNMYAKCGSLEDARSMFDVLPHRDVVTWNAMLAGYLQRGMVPEALILYKRIQQEGRCHPNSFTFVCLLQACASVADLSLGKQLHADLEDQGLGSDAAVGSALVNMYAKCGSMLDSQQVFNALAERSSEAWGALIAGYSRHGDSDTVFALFERMRVEDAKPTDVILLSVLAACSHAGLVDKGRNYFKSMQAEYGITASVEHYTCMMDLLGRAGHLEEALQIAMTMPFSPDDAVWVTLLGAYRKWDSAKVEQQAFEFAVRTG